MSVTTKTHLCYLGNPCNTWRILPAQSKARFIMRSFCMTHKSFLILLVLFTTNASEAINSKDYCEVNSERCDKHGTYKYHGVTSFEDFNIKDRLDDDFELIKLRPKLAFKRTEKPLKENPKR